MEIPLNYFEKLTSKPAKEITHEFKYIGEGASRKVYEVNELYIIKIPKGTSGKEQSDFENYLYNNANLKFKKYLCPILFYNNYRTIMKKAVPVKDLISDRDLSIFDVLNFSSKDIFKKNLKEFTKLYGLLYPDIKSITSWGLIENKPFLIDYGCTNKIYNKYFA